MDGEGGDEVMATGYYLLADKVRRGRVPLGSFASPETSPAPASACPCARCCRSCATTEFVAPSASASRGASARRRNG